jgi:uncharacterized membrane protein YphA (DoxX/SURF4 family)
LRLGVGLTASTEGFSYLSGQSNFQSYNWLLGAVLIASGAAMLLGLLTPYAGFLVGLCFVGVALSWLPAPSWGMRDARLIALGMIITTVAIGLIGPGAYSLDGRLFGRREIVIPPASRPPES